MGALTFDGERTLSHAYIVASQSEEARGSAEQDIAAAAVCSGQGERKPCGICRDCRKAKAGVHPDILHVRRLTDDKGKPKREIQVDQVREMITQAQVMPNEAEGKAFVVHDAETMNPSAQNALLKLLEEPPRGVVLILSTPAPAMLLPTIRSRCIEVTVNREAPPLSAELRQEAETYLQCVCAGSKSELLRWCSEKAAHTDTAGTVEFVNGVKTVLTDQLCGRQPAKLEPNRLFALTELMERCETALSVNTGVKHIFGLLAVKSIGAGVPEK